MARPKNIPEQNRVSPGSLLATVIAKETKAAIDAQYTLRNAVEEQARGLVEEFRNAKRALLEQVPTDITPSADLTKPRARHRPLVLVVQTSNDCVEIVWRLDWPRRKSPNSTRWRRHRQSKGLKRTQAGFCLKTLASYAHPDEFALVRETEAEARKLRALWREVTGLSLVLRSIRSFAPNQPIATFERTGSESVPLFHPDSKDARYAR